MNTKKHGQLARIGLFLAIARMFGIDMAKKRYSEHIGQGKNGGYSKGNTLVQTHGSRAGFKLVKKMYRLGPVLRVAKGKSRRKIYRAIAVSFHD